jgi:uncharacterized membrane protein
VTIDRVGGGALALLALFVLWESRKLPFGNVQNPGPAYVPTLLAVLLLGFAVTVVAAGRRSERLAAVGWAEWRHAVAILAVCAFMALGLERLGYRLTVAGALLVLLAVVERRPIVTAIVFAAGFSAISFYMFSTLLRVPLPRGPWGL